jgi:uncharacterized protein YbjT (DUF2867 family)
MSFFPVDLKFPMVAPPDIGELAAHLMMANNTPNINSIHGPELYSARDIAEAFSKALGKKVKVKVIPKDQWKATYRSMGFSEQGAESYTNMTQISLSAFEKTTDTTDFIKGKITLQEYINCLIN